MYDARDARDERLEEKCVEAQERKAGSATHVHTDVCWCSAVHINIWRHLTLWYFAYIKFLSWLSACLHSSRWKTISSPGAWPCLGPRPAHHDQLPWGQPTAALLCVFPGSASCCRWGGSPPEHSCGTSGRISWSENTLNTKSLYTYSSDMYKDLQWVKLYRHLC